MPRYLQRRRRRWYAVLEIPKALQHRFGKPRFVLSLETESLTVAEARVLRVVADWKQQLAIARSGNASLEAKVFKWRHLAEESHKAGMSWADVEDLSLEVLDSDDPDAETVHSVTFGKKHLLSEHIEGYVASKDVADKTKDMLRTDLTHFSKKFKFAQDVTRKSLIKWVENELIAEQGLAPPTCRRIISACRGYWKYLEKHKDLELLPPFEGVVPATKRKSKGAVSEKRKGFMPEHYRKLMSALPTQDTELRDLIMMGAYTGCRIEELCSLKLDKIRDDSFDIVDAKTEAGWRTVPIHSNLRELFVRLKAESRDGYLLSGLTYNKYGDRSNAIGKRFGRLKAACGFGPDYVFHSFRKGVATQLEASGVPENVCSRLLGHELGTMSYGLYSNGVPLEVLREAIDKLIW